MIGATESGDKPGVESGLTEEEEEEEENHRIFSPVRIPGEEDPPRGAKRSFIHLLTALLFDSKANRWLTKP